MAQLFTDRRDMDFVLFEQLNLEALLAYQQFGDLNKKVVGMILNEARNLAINEIHPTNVDGDRQGCVFEDGRVKVPESFHRAFSLYREGDWIALFDDPAVGGQGLPVVVSSAVGEYLTAANVAFSAYPTLCHGAGKLIEVFGTEVQKSLFLKKMYAGQWGGSMLLTEPAAGSDVGALTTRAQKLDDGAYAISGSKIFITAGEQDLTENIIHPVLARIDGAPDGTPGISLFIVPKIWVNPDGSLGAPNDVVCTGIEEKMGLHGSATCSLTLGGKGQCRGMLLGEENKGMRAMFHMMNEARLGVGIQGFALASAAFMYAMNYARERRQGRHLLAMKDPAAEPVPIIQHPDVRRMLLWMKAHVEGMRSFIYYVGQCFDRQFVEKDPEVKEVYGGLTELLTPIVKAYCSDKAFDVCTQAVQVFGGYGYISEYPVEQCLRDCKITSIYEGTNGIQAMDLLGRKMGMKQGQYFLNLVNEIQKTVDQAKSIPALEALASRLETAVGRLGETAMALGATAMSPRVMAAFAYAKPFLDAMGDVIMAWMHLWRAIAAVPRLEKLAGSLEPAVIREKAKKNKSIAFYDGVLTTAAYFIKTVLPETMGRMAVVQEAYDGVVEMPEAAFPM